MSARSHARPAARLAGLVLAVASGCSALAPSEPWDLVRGERPLPLARGETRIRTLSVSTEEAPLLAGTLLSVEHGVTDRLTVGGGIGEHLKRSSLSSRIGGAFGPFSPPPGLAEEVASVSARYGIDGDEAQGGMAAQLELVLDDAGDVEFRPSFNMLFGERGGWRASGRGGVALLDGRDPLFFVEGAYYEPIGAVYGVVELDAQVGDDLTELYVTPGLTTQLREIVQLQVGVPIGLTGDSANWQALVGLNFRF